MTYERRKIVALRIRMFACFAEWLVEFRTVKHCTKNNGEHYDDFALPPYSYEYNAVSLSNDWIYSRLFLTLILFAHVF